MQQKAKYLFGFHGALQTSRKLEIEPQGCRRSRDPRACQIPSFTPYLAHVISTWAELRTAVEFLSSRPPYSHWLTIFLIDGSGGSFQGVGRLRGRISVWAIRFVGGVCVPIEGSFA